MQVDQRLVDKRDKDEPTGEVLSLSGRIHQYEMGDKFLRSRPPRLEEKRVKRQRRDDSTKLYAKTSKGQSLLSDGMDEMVGIYYRPRTAETKSMYEMILAFIQEALGDQPRDILCGAADEVLSVLKSDKIRDKERKREIEALLGPLTEERYAVVVNLGKKITDYRLEEAKKNLEEIDETLGVNVQFEESDEEDDEDVYGEVKEDESDEGEGEEAVVETTLKTSGATVSIIRNSVVTMLFYLKCFCRLFF